MTTTETLPYPFHTSAWRLLHNNDGSLVREDIIVGMVATMLEEITTLKAEVERLEEGR